MPERWSAVGATEARQSESGEDSQHSLEALYEQNSIDYDAGDLLCIGGGGLLNRLRRFLQVLGAFHDVQGYTPFNRIIAVTPPETAAPYPTLFETLHLPAGQVQQRDEIRGLLHNAILTR